MQFVDLYRQYLTLKDEIDGAIQSVIESSAFVRGEAVESFERNFAELIGVDNCVSCANGTDAIYIALRSLGLQPGDEVITTAHSWIATSETITQAGGKVVFCDTQEEYFTIDPAEVEAKITDKTRGIIPVHLYGQPADMDAIMDIARKHNLWVIEDCAQAHLAEFNGQKVGTFGDVATFSFYPGKNLGAMGDAGALVTNREDIAEHASLFARHGGKGEHKIEGINSRLDGLQAAILNVKQKYLESWTQERQAVAAKYDQQLAEIDGITVPTVRGGCAHVYHLYVIRSKQRDQLRAHLKSLNIPTVINYARPLPLYEAYAYLGKSADDFPVATKHSQEILSIPVFPEMTDEESDCVIEAIRSFE